MCNNNDYNQLAEREQRRQRYRADEIWEVLRKKLRKNSQLMCKLTKSLHENQSDREIWCLTSLRACLHGGGGPQVGEVTRSGGFTRLSIQSLILMWSHLHVRWGNPRHVTSPTWGPQPSCKQALSAVEVKWLIRSPYPFFFCPTFLCRIKWRNFNTYHSIQFMKIA